MDSTHNICSSTYVVFFSPMGQVHVYLFFFLISIFLIFVRKYFVELTIRGQEFLSSSRGLVDFSSVAMPARNCVLANEVIIKYRYYYVFSVEYVPNAIVYRDTRCNFYFYSVPCEYFSRPSRGRDLTVGIYLVYRPLIDER